MSAGALNSPMRTINYPNAQCRHLVRAVRKLSSQLKRPVCSRDLEKHFQRFPNERPDLTQALGQQLIKAARPLSKDRLYRVGTIGNRAYYNADDNHLYWSDMLARHEADMEIEKAIKEDFPGQMAVLRDASHETLRLNALAGWRLEMEEHLLHASETFSTQIVADTLGLGAVGAGFIWAATALDDLVGKQEAIAMLTNELTCRALFKLETKINWYRYLVPLRWPQTCLFSRPAGVPVYSRRQIKLLAKSLWPEPQEESDLARAELLALRYGLPD